MRSRQGVVVWLPSLYRDAKCKSLYSCLNLYDSLLILHFSLALKKVCWCAKTDKVGNRIVSMNVLFAVRNIPLALISFLASAAKLVLGRFTNSKQNFGNLSRT